VIALRLLLFAVLGAPVLAGAGIALAQAFDLPGRPGPGAFAAALALPGVGRGLLVTLISGIGATLLALALSVPLARWLLARPGAQRWLAPLLAVPHAALAIGLAFVIAPSGWIARLLAPLAGWTAPPALVTLGDDWGLALALGLVLKEVPFLLLMTLAAAGQLPVATQMATGRSLGYPPAQVWRRAIWPQIFPALRLPVAIVLAFSLSVADMALILGPSHPPTLAVQILRLSAAADPALAAPAAALSVLLLALMAGCVALVWLVEPVLARIGRAWIEAGQRGSPGPSPALVALAGAALSLAALAALTLWAFARRWPWPAPLPEPGLVAWQRADWGTPALTTLGLGLAAVLIALGLAIAVLEAQDRGARLPLGALIALPLLLPQIGFLPGLTTAFLWLGLPPGPVAVLWAELLFVFPYVMIALAGPWRALDAGLLRSAASLGAGPLRRLIAVKLPVLLAPLAAAAAVGFAVAAAQYLAVLLPGAGRVATLGTEAVARAAGADRRLAAALGLLQAALPLAGFALALALPAWLHRNRRGLRPEGLR